MLSVEHVTFGYKPKIKVIDDINFEVNKGLIMGLLGHNGAGKTTTLRLILGLLRPQSGKIEVDGYIPESPFIPRRLISYMPETSGVYERLTGFQNLEFRARAAGLDLKQIRTLSTTWLDRLGLLDRGHEKAGTWSKGLRQRLSLACALICQTSLLLLDEPTSGLDPESLSVFVRVLQAYVRDIVQRMMLCRDPDGGYARWVCPSCQYEHRVPFSCKTRFCPSCGKVRVDNWVNNIAKDMLDVPHLHITLTTDDSFRPFFRRESRLLKELLRVGAQAVQEVISDLYPGMRIGLVYTAHTAGRDLGYKPHVHLVITKGGLLDGKWVEIECVPGNRLSAKWRYLLCKRLRELCPSDTVLQQVIAKTYNDHHGFMVHTESFYPKGIEAARYIGRYLGHPPLATSHLTDYDGKTVTFWYKDTQTGEKIVVRCSALDFISYMVPHIPPKGLQMVRYAGLYARCVKRRCLDIANAALEAIRAQIPLFALDPWLKSVAPLKWRDRIKASFGYDPLSCPLCGRTMELVEIWEPKRGFVWMQRWLETHRMRKAARDAMKEAAQVKQPTHRPKLPRQYQQLPLAWNTS